LVEKKDAQVQLSKQEQKASLPMAVGMLRAKLDELRAKNTKGARKAAAGANEAPQ
jgi:hypothetical protein